MTKQPPKKPASEPDKANSEPSQTPNTTTESSETDAAVTSEATSVMTKQVQTLSDADLNDALKMLRAEVRRRENEREALRPRVGSKVRILKGRPKYVDKIGTALIVRRSRCFVTVPEISSPAYVLISDLELVER